jgi:large subunit ribosomal protein L4
MKLSVIDINGQETGKSVDLPSSIFGVEPNDHAIYLDVKQYLANQRQGTAASTVKGDITGSTRKLKKQKGTGTARAGSIKSGVFRGGGRIHGPQPRDYSFKLNKKLKQVARKSALAYKAQENRIKVLSELNINSPKTKDFVALLNNLNVNNESTLLVVPNHNTNVYLSSRNVPKAKVLTASDINTYEVLKAKNLVLVDGSIEIINGILN